MANLSESSTWEAGIYQLETTDPVLAGAGGIANRQAEQLANRTKYLKDQVDSLSSLNLKGPYFADFVSATGSLSIPGSGAGKLHKVDPNGSNGVAVTLPSSMTDKTVVGVYCGGNGSLLVSPGVLDAFGISGMTSIKLGKGDTLVVQYKASGVPNVGTWHLVALTKGIEYAPPGTVMAFAANTPPTGWLKCNGAPLDKLVYVDLYNAIGDTFGGDEDFFSVPDLRGEFIRGWSDGRSVDSGRTFGSAQSDELKAHTHNYKRDTSTASGGGGWGSNPSGSDVATSSTGGSETRPRNIALLYCIKY